MKLSIVGKCGPGYATVRRVVGDAVVEARVATKDGGVVHSVSMGPCGECQPVYDAAVRMAGDAPVMYRARPNCGG